MDKYETKQYAVEREVARARRIDVLIDQLPKRKSKGDELTSLVALIQNSHALLTIYDALHDSDVGLAGSVETTLDAAIERLGEVIAERAAEARHKPA